MSKPADGRPRFVLELEALPDDAPAETRLKRLLKTALRRYGFRCRSAEIVRPEPAAAEKESADAEARH